MSEALDEGGITEGQRAIELFTDRHESCRRFVTYVNDDPPASTVLWFYGDGGTGKSLLLDYLRTILCKRIKPENWAYLRGLSDEECLAQVAAAADSELVSAARLDFAYDAADGYTPLLKLRRGFGGTSLRFPLFDFAIVTYLHKSRQLTPDRLGSLFPTDELDLVLELAELARELPGASLVVAALTVIDKHLGNWFQRYRQRRKLEESHLKAILQMDHEKELIQQLPRLFAEDLNAGLGDSSGPARVALFFDSHEAIWGHERNLVGELYFGRDEWLRRLFRALDRSAGIVVVAAGRDVPQWDVPGSQYRFTDLDLCFVGDLAKSDALVYLRRAGVTDPEVRTRLCEDAQVGPDHVHPFYLGLGADLALAAAERGAILGKEDLKLGPDAEHRHCRLVNRLLKYVDTELRDAVVALSACRSFDRNIYHYLGDQLSFPTSRAGFGLLTGFSFVRRIDGETDRYRLHDLLRRVTAGEGEGLRTESDAAMERYYREQAAEGDELAVIDAIYHANRLDWKRGAAEWIDVFDQAVRSSRFDLAAALLVVGTELRIDTPHLRGEVSYQEATYFKKLARYSEAAASYDKSIATYAGALKQDPDSLQLIHDRGVALTGQGDLLALLAHHEAALASYNAATADFQIVLSRAPGYVEVNNNLGVAMRSRGDVQAALSDHEAALASYSKAVATYRDALSRAPGHSLLLNNLGVALRSRGQVQTQLARHQAAQASYSESISAHLAVMALVPNDVDTLNNLGNALSAHGQAQARLENSRAALASHNDAISAYRGALARVPGDPLTLNNLGVALTTRGEVQATLTDGEAAVASYNEAIATYCEALLRAPDDPELLGNLGNTLANRGQVLAWLSDRPAALASYSEAIAIYRRALARVPDSPTALNNLGNVLACRGELQANLADYKGAAASYNDSIAAYQQALVRAPDYISALSNLGQAYERLGRLKAVVHGDERAEEVVALFRLARKAYLRGCSLAGNDHRLHEALKSIESTLNLRDPGAAT